jgi:hypothetical protein
MLNVTQNRNYDVTQNRNYVKCDSKSKLPIHRHSQMSQQQQQQQRQVPFNIFLDIFKTEIQCATPR